jgi:hypothetical protein
MAAASIDADPGVSNTAMTTAQSTAMGRGEPSDPAGPDDAGVFSPVDNETPLRLWRRLHLAPAGELGVRRRAVLLALVAWLPIVTWALATGRLPGGTGDESLVMHYGIHARCLVVIPLLILAEAGLHRAGKDIAWQFVASGVVTPALRPGFDAAIRSVARLRDASLPWVFAIGVAIAWALADAPRANDEEMAWSVGTDGTIGFGGVWLAYVVRPMLFALIIGWLWRLALVTGWMWRVARLPLSLVPTHPDRTGGIAFVEKLPGALALVTFALSAMIASRWAHEVVHHEASLASFQPALIAHAVVWSLALLMPILAVAPALRSARKSALPAYSALVGEQGRLVHRRWIERKPIDDDSLLEAPGIGPVADAEALYAAVKRMRTLAIGKHTLQNILLPMAIPFCLLALLKFPLASILSTLFKVLI